MTIDESQELRLIMEKWGYRIYKYSDPLQWCAKIPTDRDTRRFGYGMGIVDCSYDDIIYIKYRNRLKGETEKELYVMKELKDCSMQEIIDKTGPVTLIMKKLKESERLASLKDDFK